MLHVTMLHVIVIVLMILWDRCSHIVIVTAIVITTDVQLSRNATIRHFLNLSWLYLYDRLPSNVFKVYLSPSKISAITNGPLNFGSSLVWFLFSFLRGTKSPRLNLTTLALFLSNLFLLYWALLSMFYTACCLTSGISTSFSLILSGSNRSYGLAVLPISSCKGLELVTRLVVQFNASGISPIASCHGRPVVSTVVNVFSMYA